MGKILKLLAAGALFVVADLLTKSNSNSNKTSSVTDDSNIDDDIDVYCPMCKTKMEKHGEEWICFKCGNRGYQEDPDDPEDIYFEHDRNEYNMFYAEDPEDYEDEDDIPEGCRACGGDYPNCISGCNLMDD